MGQLQANLSFCHPIIIWNMTVSIKCVNIQSNPSLRLLTRISLESISNVVHHISIGLLYSVYMYNENDKEYEEMMSL
jgi:hypothetical protein